MATERDDFMSSPQQFGEVRQRTQKKKRRKMLITKLITDYLSNCSLHGLQYIAEDGLSIVERVFWVSIFVISVGMCGVLINNVWIKWNTSPVIVSFNERVVPVGKVPFPSVTICPQIKSLATEFNFTEHMRLISEIETLNKTLSSSEESDFLRGEDIALICSDEEFYDTSANNTISRGKYANSSIVDNIIQVSSDITHSFMTCVWKNKEMDCDDVFKRVLTSEGVCFNFNALAEDEIFNKNNIQNDYVYLNTTTKSRNWNLLHGYTNNDPDSYPRRASENGAKPDLVVVLSELVDERDEMCNGMNRGFKIYVQHPADVPQSTLYYYAALPNQVSSIALKFSMLTTSENLINYPADVRQCYFPNDRPLRYFNTYTASNCLLECQSNYTFQKCGCVAFHMPHNDSQHICTIQSNACVVDAQEELSRSDEEDGAGACKCYPDCHSIMYDAEILKTDFNLNNFMRSYMRIHNESIDFDGFMEFSKVEFYFKQPRFISMQRSELFGATDFLANCGGLLGLFLGFSFLSLVEIIYFISLRFCCEVKRDTRKEEEKISLSEKSKLND